MYKSVPKPYTPGRQQSRMVDSQKQKVIMDQHYSNNVAMMALSTLQSLKGAYTNTPARRQNKMYGHYDKVNYDNKNYSQLKSQLQTHLTLLKASHQVFKEENPKAKYEMPDSFNQQRMKSQIGKYKGVFKDDKEVRKMCGDFEKIVSGDHQSPYTFQKNDYTIKYPEQVASKHKREIVKRGIQAKIEMDNERLKIQNLNIKNQRDLPIYVKQNPRKNFKSNYSRYY